MPLCTLNIYLGTDLVHIPRVQPVLNQFGKRFLQRVYTATKPQDCWQTSAHPASSKHQIVRLARQWAAKEAGVKGLEPDWRGTRYTNVAIQQHPSGAPKVCLYGAAATTAKYYESGTWQLSLSHSGDDAIATVFSWMSKTPPKSLYQISCYSLPYCYPTVIL